MKMHFIGVKYVNYDVQDYSVLFYIRMVLGSSVTPTFRYWHKKLPRDIIRSNNRIRNAKHITQHAKGKKHKKKKQRLCRGQKNGALLSLFRLKHEDLAHDILDCIHKRLALPVSDWQTVQLDRASVNKAAINKIRTEILDANP